MLNMSDLSRELWLAEELYTFPFKNNSLDSVLLNPGDILPKQHRVRKLTFLLSTLN